MKPVRSRADDRIYGPLDRQRWWSNLGLRTSASSGAAQALSAPLKNRTSALKERSSPEAPSGGFDSRRLHPKMPRPLTEGLRPACPPVFSLVPLAEPPVLQLLEEGGAGQAQLLGGAVLVVAAAAQGTGRTARSR